MSGVIDRAFTRIAEGQVHLRRLDGAGTGRPLVLVHASPGSSHGLIGMMQALHAVRPDLTLIAPDTVGSGDSVAVAHDDPEVSDYADALIRVLDSLGVEKADLYGVHTGARIICEAAVLHPDRVGCVILDGIAEYEPALRDELLARYAPKKAPDDYGTQFLWAFSFVRDMNLHFPHYDRTPARRLMGRPVPSAEALHNSAMEVLKALGTYDKAYNAVFRYPAKARMALLKRPAMLIETATEIPGLNASVAEMAALAQKGEVVKVGGDLTEKAKAICAYLQRCG